MDRFQQLNAFVAVAETGGFAAGARRLGLSPPAVTRAVASLEGALGAKLFDRTTRSVRATEAGARYLEDSKRILLELDVADAAVAGMHQAPRGQLSVTAPVLFGRQYVLPCIVEYLRKFPETQVSALYLDRNVNLVEEGIDVGIRVGELMDSGLQARRLGEIRLVLCASPAYLKQHGRPESPRDLNAHCLVVSRAAGPASQWRFRHGRETDAIRLKPRLNVNSNAAAIDAAREGFGITRLLSYQVAEYISDGSLKILLPDFEPPPRPVHLLHREGLHARARVRSFIDLVYERLSGHAALA